MKSLFIKSGAFAFALLVSLSSCEELLIDPVKSRSADNFEYVWQKFDEHYGLFLVKNVNWDSVYEKSPVSCAVSQQSG